MKLNETFKFAIGDLVAMDFTVSDEMIGTVISFDPSEDADTWYQVRWMNHPGTLKIYVDYHAEYELKKI